MIFYIQIFTLIVAVVNLWLGAFILLRSRQDKTKIFFGILAIIVGLWVFSNFILRIVANYFLQRFTFSIAALLPFFAILWLFYFQGSLTKRKKVILWVLGFCSVIFFFLPLFGDIIVKTALPVYDPFAGFEPGRLFSLYVIYFSLFAFLPLFICADIWRRSKGIKREQIKYIFFGFLLFIITGTLFSLFLPLIGINKFSSLDCTFSIFFVCFSTYSITRYRLMDIKMIISRSIVFLLLSGIITGIFILVFAISALLFSNTFGANPYLIWIITSIIVVLGLDPLKKLLAKASDKIFFQGNIDYDAVLKEQTEVLAEELSVKNIISHIEKNLKKQLKLSKVTMRMYAGSGYFLHAQEDKIIEYTVEALNKRQAVSCPNLADYFTKNQKIIIFDELEKILEDSFENTEKEQLKKVYQEMAKFNAGAIIPIYKNQQITAMLILGAKNSGDIFNSQDIKTLEILAPQLSAALYKASLYQEAQLFNLKLKSEIAKATKNLKVINKQLAHANSHLQDLDLAKSEFMSITSHQLRTPLSGIMGYLSMILDGDYGKINKKQYPVLKDVFEATLRLIRMVNLFLNISRIEAGRFNMLYSEIDLYDLLAQTKKEMQAAAEKKGLELVFVRPEKSILKIQLDFDKIKDVLLNLIDNAIKYTDQGKVEIFAKAINANTVQIIIADTGMGVKKGEADKLFNKFVRGDGMMKINPSGAGLGLFIAKKIVEGHHGRIWVESAGHGEGATFFVELPVKQK